MPGDAAREIAPSPNSSEVEAAFQAAPDITIAEILDGKLFVMPRPGKAHTRATSVLGVVVGGPFGLGIGGPGGWVILDEPEIHLGPRPDKVVSDLAGWRRERMPDAVGPPGGPAHYDVAPDWTCEVLSDRTEPNDRGKKMRIYRREGIGHLWLVNPVQHTLEVYRLAGGNYVLVDTFEGDDKVRAEPFDSLELDLSVLWAP